MKHLTLFFSLFFLVIVVNSQNYFIKSFDSPGVNKAFGVLQDTDNGFVVSGHSQNNILLMKTDENGNVLWKHSYPGTPDQEEGKVCDKKTDGGFVISGYTKSTSENFYSMIISTDSIGNKLWIKKFGNNSTHNKAWPISVTNNNEIYFAGWTQDDIQNPTWISGFIIKLNSNGDTIWTRRFGQQLNSFTYFRSLIATTDGGCIAVGETNEYGVGSYDAFAVKLNSNGDTIWTRTYGSSGDDYAWSVKELSTGDYIIGGNTGSFEYSNQRGDALIMKIDQNGNFIWAKTLGDNNDSTTLDAIRCVHELSNGNFAFSGYSGIPGDTTGNEEGMIGVINSNGDSLWIKLYPIGLKNEHFRYINESSNGDLIVTGYTSSLTTGDDLLLLKVKNNGFAGGCFESSVPSAFQYNTHMLETTSGINIGFDNINITSLNNSTIPNFNETIVCDSILSNVIVETIDDSRFILSPNPATDFISIKKIQNTSVKKIEIISIDGRQSKYIKWDNSSELVIKVSDFESGIYIINIYSENNEPYSSKFIKE